MCYLISPLSCASCHMYVCGQMYQRSSLCELSHVCVGFKNSHATSSSYLKKNLCIEVSIKVVIILVANKFISFGMCYSNK